MKHYKIFYFIIIVYSLGLSCYGQITPSNYQVFGKFNSESFIPMEKVAKFDDILAAQVYFKDSLLLLCDVDGNTDYFFNVISLASKKIKGKYIEYGRAQGQALNAFSNGICQNNFLWVNDISAKKIIIVDIDKAQQKNSSINEYLSEYSFTRNFYKGQLIDSASILVTGSDFSKGKLQLLNLRTREVVKEYGHYENVPDDIPFFSWKSAHEGFVYTNPSQSKAIIACRYTDQIEIFNLDDSTSKIIQGPENYKPEFTPIKVLGGDISARTSKTRTAFASGFVTEKHIYLLYSGKLSNEKNTYQTKYIFVYDWKGNPIKKITLDNEVSSIAITNNEKTIYAFDASSGNILKGKLNN
ncbi:MAG: hypothetical protein EWV61_22415 [Microcystis aeruginosa Ma_AC_P_19900807_S300]|nr:MAG: hypothetical protein EWV61_22415 [Microcystis aeruginosa Ma_AC_P_19900807_S300]